MGWVERGVEAGRIGGENESPSAISQQKEDVVPPLVLMGPTGGRGDPGTLAIRPTKRKNG
jgi:hypothetical protein